MWRACRQVLGPAGRVGGYVIHAPSGLSSGDARRARELGPSEVLARASPAEQAEVNGFRVLVEEDVTAEFAATCEAILEAREDLATELIAEEGAAVFEDERLKKVHMREGIRSGLLVRSLLVVERKPTPVLRDR